MPARTWRSVKGHSTGETRELKRERARRTRFRVGATRKPKVRGSHGATSSVADGVRQQKFNSEERRRKIFPVIAFSRTLSCVSVSLVSVISPPDLALSMKDIGTRSWRDWYKCLKRRSPPVFVSFIRDAITRWTEKAFPLYLRFSLDSIGNHDNLELSI